MGKIKIFISSVQSEFSEERKLLYEYFLADPLIGKFFEPFLFEKLPATDSEVDTVYLQEVEYCDIYLGILGKEYGHEDGKGISPTEHEFNHASKHHKTRLIFISKAENRNIKEVQFIHKVQNVLVRKSFNSIGELKSSVYAALVKYLIQKEIIRTAPFDASTDANATLKDIDSQKIKNFVRLAKAKRGFSLNEGSDKKTVLTHLNLMDGNRVKNSAILLFGKSPQRFFITSEIRCAYFHGTKAVKPIQSYKVFKGDVFELVDQAVDFV